MDSVQDAINTLLMDEGDSPFIGEIVDFLNMFHEEGRINAFGGSNWTAERISQANAYAAQHGLKASLYPVPITA